MIRLLKLSAACALVGIGAGIYAFASAPPGDKTPRPGREPALTVTAATAREVDWPVTVSASGAIAAWQESSVGAQVSGYRLIEVDVNVGDIVKRGQMLARIDAEQLRAAVRQSAATLAQAEATAAQAELNRARMTGLRDSGGISEQEILQYVTQARTSKAQVDYARAVLEQQRIQLRDTEVRAPDDGVISARDATAGSIVTTGQTLFRLIRRNRLEWRGELTASQLAQIGIGDTVALSLPDGTSADARVRSLAPSLDPKTRLALVYADIVPGSHARAGMYASGVLSVGRHKALVVPSDSVVVRDGISYVLALHDGSATPNVDRLTVTVGRRLGNEVEILSGLVNGRRVVVQGAGFLNDGNVVRVAHAQAGGAS
ncbi:efflux RND transporter periplasmic adaptor subunit [Burkholderia sp. BCC0419]|uniref:efflux RND transporter periplasmic adaptor subunit n=1 Tax=Burkholderia sp. BCC0419 TaxID=486878 RepID=UPI001FC8C4E6|nr:efflux RND transporter periplasmic adaptor subunit [Burkholderia sp. BCC0419]